MALVDEVRAQQAESKTATQASAAGLATLVQDVTKLVDLANTPGVDVADIQEAAENIREVAVALSDTAALAAAKHDTASLENRAKVEAVEASKQHRERLGAEPKNVADPFTPRKR